MSALGIVALVAVAAWLLVLTISLLATIRQIALVMVRLDTDAGTAAPVDDGIDVNEPAPAELLPLLPEHPELPSFVLVLAGVCNPCRELAPRLDEVRTSLTLTVLVTGSHEQLVDEVADMLPASARSVVGETASTAVSALRIRTTPFAFEFRDGRLAAKAAIRDIDHLKSYVEEAENVSTSKLWPPLEVVAP
jgi:hypothetical protein